MVCTSSLVGHDALGSGNDCNAEALQDAGQFFSTGVDTQTGLGDAAQAGNNLFLAGEILQGDADDTLAS